MVEWISLEFRIEKKEKENEKKDKVRWKGEEGKCEKQKEKEKEKNKEKEEKEKKGEKEKKEKDKEKKKTSELTISPCPSCLGKISLIETLITKKKWNKLKREREREQDVPVRNVHVITKDWHTLLVMLLCTLQIV